VLSDIGFGEILVIAVVGLLVFGPDRLPEMARQAGGWLRDLRTMVASARSEMTDNLGVDAKYLTDPKGSLTKDLLGDDLPRVPKVPNTSDAVSKALGLDDTPTKPQVDGIDPDVT
jgi:Tat protein translocase TatB subunit